jgi:hypothetical protein
MPLTTARHVPLHNKAMAMTRAQKRLVIRLTGFWYLTLGLAFAALAWRNVLYEAPLSGTVLRGIIAVFFCILGIQTLRSSRTM